MLKPRTVKQQPRVRGGEITLTVETDGAWLNGEAEQLEAVIVKAVVKAVTKAIVESPQSGCLKS